MTTAKRLPSLDIEIANALEKEPLMGVHVCESLFHSCTLTLNHHQTHQTEPAPMDATLVPSPDMDTIVPRSLLSSHFR